nr:DUF397 domain-containing protein [Actinopolymorpha pittospori]
MRYEELSGWRKATASNGGSNCVEVGSSATHVGVRDTKDRDGGTLAVTRTGFAAFLGGVKAGEFDLPR